MATGNITRLEGVWPETHERAVRDSAGVNLETKLGNINSNISQLGQEVNGLRIQGTTTQYIAANLKAGNAYVVENLSLNITIYFRNAQSSEGQASLLVKKGERKVFTPQSDFKYIYITGTSYDLFFYPEGCLRAELEDADTVLEQKIDGISISTLSNTYNKIFIKSGISYVVENKTSVNASVNFRIDQSNKGQLSATIPAGGKVTITPEVDYNFVYIYTPSSSERIYSLFVYPEESACDKIRELEEEVESINSEINVVDDIPFSVSGYINVNGAVSASDSYHTTDFIEVQTGEKLTFTLGGSSSVIVVAGYNDKKKFVRKLINSSTWIDKEIEIPQSVSFVRLCTNRENSYAKLSHNSWASRQNAIDANSFNGYFKDRITITKFGDVFNVYVRTKSGSILKYKFVHYQKTFENVPYGNGQIKESVLASDTWGMEDITHNDELIAWGSTSFIFREDGKSHHSGDQHGLEVALLDAFLLDGEPMDLASMQTGVSISGSSFEIIRKSEVYRYGTGSPNNYSNNVPELDADGNPVVLAEHFMRVIFNDNGYELDNQLCIKQNNLVFANLYGAMFDVPYSKIGTVICNHKSGIVNTVNNGVYTPIAGSSIELKNVYVPNSDEGVVFGQGFSMMQTMESNRQQAPGIYFMDYASVRHLKLYFQPARTTMYSEGEPEVFNEGDIIRVYDKRVINIPG